MTIQKGGIEWGVLESYSLGPMLDQKSKGRSCKLLQTFSSLMLSRERERERRGEREREREREIYIYIYIYI